MREDLRVSLISRILSFGSDLPPVLLERRRRNIPIYFLEVTKNSKSEFFYQGEKVQAKEIGQRRKIIHLNFREMKIHAINSDLTDLFYLNSNNYNLVNGFYILDNKIQRVDKYNTITTYQPLSILNKHIKLI